MVIYANIRDCNNIWIELKILNIKGDKNFIRENRVKLIIRGYK